MKNMTVSPYNPLRKKQLFHYDCPFSFSLNEIFGGLVQYREELVEEAENSLPPNLTHKKKIIFNHYESSVLRTDKWKNQYPLPAAFFIAPDDNMIDLLSSYLQGEIFVFLPVSFEMLKRKEGSFWLKIVSVLGENNPKLMFVPIYEDSWIKSIASYIKSINPYVSYWSCYNLNYLALTKLLYIVNSWLFSGNDLFDQPRLFLMNNVRFIRTFNTCCANYFRFIVPDDWHMPVLEMPDLFGKGLSEDKEIDIERSFMMFSKFSNFCSDIFYEFTPDLFNLAGKISDEWFYRIFLYKKTYTIMKSIHDTMNSLHKDSFMRSYEEQFPDKINIDDFFWKNYYFRYDSLIDKSGAEHDF
jgi:hypothetical protein